MLALAIISTFILGILILLFFGANVVDGDGAVLAFATMTLLGFVIMTIWVLYAR